VDYDFWEDLLRNVVVAGMCHATLQDLLEGGGYWI
jgi:hypothetical protein